MNKVINIKWLGTNSCQILQQIPNATWCPTSKTIRFYEQGLTAHVGDIIEYDTRRQQVFIHTREFMTSGEALELLNQGELLCRAGWNGKDLFVFKQVPSFIEIGYVPNMQSLPVKVKEEFVRRFKQDFTLEGITYNNQFAIVNAFNQISGWAPSSSDFLATDWQLYTSKTD
jgi:hypothetical protein